MTARRTPAHVRPPIVPERVRRIDGDGFAFIPNRFLRDGFFVSLERDELALYLFLVLVGDRSGGSFYRYDSICSVLECSLEDYITARNGLIEKDLIAFDGTRFQVLSLPARSAAHASTPLRSSEQLAQRDPATIRRSLLDALQRDADDEI